MIYKIGTRGSALALAQTETVRSALKAAFPEHDFEIVVIKTTGDRVKERSLREMGTAGIFTRELEERLLSGEIDIAIHSMKDMPAAVPEGLVLSSVLKREDPWDVLITPDGKNLAQLPKGAVVGTGSLRRKYQLLALRQDLVITDIRGNIDTRIRKMKENGLDGIVLAAAALKRLGLTEEISQYFSPEEMLPAPTQGILGAEFAARRSDVAKLLEAVREPETELAAAAERRFLAVMQVGCHMPVGAFCRRTEAGLTLRVLYGNEDGSNQQFAETTGGDPDTLAELAARALQR